MIMLTMIIALMVTSLGGMVIFQVSGSIDTMSSEAATSFNSTATTFAVGGIFGFVAIIVIIIVALLLVGFCTAGMGFR